VPAKDLLRFEATDQPGRWRVPISPRLLTNSGAIQGGAVFAAALKAMELMVGRPVVWASAQFLRHAGPDGTLDVVVELPVAGRLTTQAQARVTVGRTDVLFAMGALGTRPFEAGDVWSAPPGVPPPDHLARATFPAPGAGGIVDLVDVRPALGRHDDEFDGSRGAGRWAAWCRLVDAPVAMQVSVADLAIIADFSVLALADALGRRVMGNSVDNTLRPVSREASGWVLLDVWVEAVHEGFAHVAARLWGRDGGLLATASQTLVLREADTHGRAVRGTRRIVGGDPA
jgi:acyl-CoA thioesterase